MLISFLKKSVLIFFISLISSYASLANNQDKIFQDQLPNGRQGPKMVVIPAGSFGKRYQGWEQRCIFKRIRPNTRRVIRGGSWFDRPKKVRAAQRGWNLLDSRRSFVGFRLVRHLNPSEQAKFCH